MSWISNAVVTLLILGGVALGFAIRGNPLWRDAAVSLGRRRPISLVCVALFVAVGLLDSISWVALEATERNFKSPNLCADSTSAIPKTENGYEEGCARGASRVAKASVFLAFVAVTAEAFFVSVIS